MRLNLSFNHPYKTHEGAPAPRIDAEQMLRRSVLSCLLWENEFYEDGETIADRISEYAGKVRPSVLANLAIEARSHFNLRHVPLLLLCELAKTGGPIVSDTIAKTIQRADELTELLAVYWRNGKRPLPAQIKKGLAKAFCGFSEYQLAKYNRDNAIKLRDVLFLTHAKPKDAEQADVWKRLIDGTLESPDTWEVNLSGGANKRETFERLLKEQKLGYLALLRNLRNMAEAGVDPGLIRDAIIARRGAKRVLPFRYIAAARACPRMEPAIDRALSEAISEIPPFHGKTAILVDVSGSMNSALSNRSDMTRMDAAAALGAIVPGDVRLFTFSYQIVEVPPRRGMAGVDAIIRSQLHRGTFLGAAIEVINRDVAYDRLIVITDEQSADRVPGPKGKGYMINVASNRNGVGYGPWVHIDGFSESVLKFIHEYESSRAF